MSADLDQTATDWDPDEAVVPLATGAPDGLSLLIRDHGAAIDQAIRVRAEAPGPRRAAVLATAIDAYADAKGPPAGVRTYLLSLAFGAVGAPNDAVSAAIRQHLAALSSSDQVLLWYAHVEHEPKAARRAEAATAALLAALGGEIGADEPSDLGIAIARARFGDLGADYARTSAGPGIAAIIRPPGGLSWVERAGLVLVALGLVIGLLALAGAINLLISVL